MLNICIGYDQNEAVAFHVLAHSILRRASRPVAIIPIYLPQLQASGLYTRERNPKQSTDFTFARFLTPYLAASRVSIFLDCDMLCLTDICELEDLAIADPYQDIHVIKHSYIPKGERKFLDNEQTLYPCKNWSSLMVFNGSRMAVKNLTPAAVNSLSPMELHQFKWCKNIGELPVEYNHLVGEYAPNPSAKIIHFTNGGPWFRAYQNCEFSNEWFEEYDHAFHNTKDPY
jgi:lipopolysaccharide biosynthesis glycosyltransferase